MKAENYVGLLSVFWAQNGSASNWNYGMFLMLLCEATATGGV